MLLEEICFGYFCPFYLMVTSEAFFLCVSILYHFSWKTSQRVTGWDT